MKASEIMTTDVVTVRPATTVRQAAKLLTDRAVASLPVLVSAHRVIGMVSESDLIRGRLPGDERSHMRPLPPDLPDPVDLVGQVMTEAAVCVGADADTAELAALMLDTNIRAIPVVDGAQLVGIVSRRDLLRTLLRDDSAVAAEVGERVTQFLGGSVPVRIRVVSGVATIRGRFGSPEIAAGVDRIVRSVPGVLRVHLVPAPEVIRQGDR